MGTCTPLPNTHKPTLNSKRVEDIFRQLFLKPFNTLLIGGADEPLYLPANSDCAHHRLFYREDYLSSAFHEISHWCIAGEQRRQQVDFGYWYHPDGRSGEQQSQFEQVEVKPQALEWHLSVVAGHRFHLSADNLNGEQGISEAFAEAVCQQARHYCQQGLPPRGQMLADYLQQQFCGQPNNRDLYRREYL